MTLFLAFDTETTGLVNDRAPPSDPSQPQLVQLAAILAEEETGIERGSLSMIVKPDGYTIPEQAAAVHGITQDRAMECGVPLLVALACWNGLVKIAQRHVAHNAQFDLKVLQAAFHRIRRPFPLVDPRCTKELASPVMKLPPTPRMVQAGFGHKNKDPNLTECIKFFFDEDLEGAHDAFVDTRACARVYVELVKRGTVK